MEPVKSVKIYLINHRSRFMVIGLLLLIIGLGSYFRFFNIGKLSFWGDEIQTFMFSNGTFLHLLVSIKNDVNMSLYYAIAFLWIHIFPNATDGLLRALSAIFSVASIPVVFLLGDAMTTDRKMAAAIGLVSAFLTAINAFNIQYAQEFRSYSLAFFLTALSTLLLIKVVETAGLKRHWQLWYVIITVAAVYSHLQAGFIIASQAITLPILLLDKNRHYLNRWIIFCGVGITLAILPITIIAYLKGAGQISWVPEPDIGTVRDFFVTLSGSPGRLLISLYLLFVGIGLFFGTAGGYQRDLVTRWKFSLMASCLFLPIIGTFVISKTIMPMFVTRYLLFVMPYFVILAASGIVATAAWSRMKMLYLKLPFFVAGIVAMFMITILAIRGTQNYYDTYQKADWRSVSQFLGKKCSDSLILPFPPTIADNVAYYNSSFNTQGLIWWNTLLSSNPSSNEIAASLPKRYGQVCLALGHINTQQKTEEERIRVAIQGNYPNETVKRFYGIDVEIFKY